MTKEKRRKDWKWIYGNSTMGIFSKQITNQIEHLTSIREDSNVITEKADALILTIHTLRSDLASTRSNILSTTYNLDYL